ncbi:MAG TPA: endopeptidase La [Thermomicrobiales bacterium]|nr:endopeptidase La [Thermomicrobiales bacterium]
MRQHPALSLDDPDATFAEDGRLPLLALKNVVIFPRNVVTLLIARNRSIHAVEEALSGNQELVVTTPHDPIIDDPEPEDMYDIGTRVSILSAERQQGGNFQVVLEGIGRVRLTAFDHSRPFYTVVPIDLKEPEFDPHEARIMIEHIQELAQRYAEAKDTLSTEVLEMIQQATHPGHLADMLATQVLDDVPRRQRLLETTDPLVRLERLGARLTDQLEVVELERRIRDRVRDNMDKSQREYYLRQQLEVIHDELGGGEGNEIEQLRATIGERQMPALVREKLQRELTRLERMPGVSAEATVARTYIDTVLALPWTECTEDRIDLDEADRVLSADHYGLDTVKERISEFLAVRKLTASAGTVTSAQILCLVGPPGVGKTSLGHSVAEAMSREFIRVSLGGVRDEAEIRGHRRTYIGAMPGRIISAMKTAGTINPVILLDEIDKLASDYRGDPTAAMLEVLDPEQNSTFTDHYLDTTYDLSQVLFITTANSAQAIPGPLRDRMEMIQVPGYTEDEKIEIARRHLLRRQLQASGLTEQSVAISDDVWRHIIRGYTREAGVRGLDRAVGQLLRKVATLVVRGKTDPSGTVQIDEERLEEFLGPRKFGFEQDLGGSQVGLAIGLGTTEIGGEIIPVEVATMPGHGGLTITGRAGDVMQESARAALSYARSRSDELRIDRDFQDKLDLHIHLPEGATPKDGPSAGITMATAVISALTRRPVRADTAMTGEISLLGRVLPIGGIRDKALAAHRHGLRRLIVPIDNSRDLHDIPANVRDEIDIVLVNTMDQVIQEALILDDQQIEGMQEMTDRRYASVPRIHPDIIDAGSR